MEVIVQNKVAPFYGPVYVSVRYPWHTQTEANKSLNHSFGL